MKNFLLRLLTGIIYVSCVVGCLLGGPYTFAVLFGVILVACLWEFYGLINKYEGVDVVRWLNVAGGIFLFGATFIFIKYQTGLEIYFPYLFYILVVFVSELYRKKENPLLNWAYSFLGQLYIVLPITLLNRIAFFPSVTGMEYVFLFLLALFVFAWVNDTGAYLIGMSLGRHRLFERISPKKSWEGFFGGLVFTMLSAVVFWYFYPDYPLWNWILLSVFVVILGTFGDLTESLLKRTMQVKDSGNVLPGHGGALDRFDSILFGIYGMFIYIFLFF